jgi:hypothetical protein
MHFLNNDPGVPLRFTPGFMLSPATAGWESYSRRSWGSASLHPRLYAVARYRGLGILLTPILGFASLHPRLYAATRYRGLGILLTPILGFRFASPQAQSCHPLPRAGNLTHADPGVPLRCTSGFMLSPATAGWESYSRRSWGSASLHPRLYAVARYRGLAILLALILGFRFAAPQALCCHPLRRFSPIRNNFAFGHIVTVDVNASVPTRVAAPLWQLEFDQSHQVY